jgi:glycosyltransferase involved in cell wall biosynthesis
VSRPRSPDTIGLGFNARLLQFAETRGWNRYAVELLAELPACGIEPILYSDRPIYTHHLARLGDVANSVRISPRLPYLVWEQAWLPWACRLDRVDVLHSPYHFGLPWFKPCPMVLTLHDAIDWAFGGNRRGDYRSRFHQWVARTRADRIVTVSQHSRGDLTRYLHVSPSKITVIPEAADARFSQVPDKEDRVRVRGLIDWDGPYLFYIGGWENRKNLPFLIRAFAEAGLEGVALVLGGGKDELRGELHEMAKCSGVQDRVRMPGYVPDAKLPALYAEALAFVYPSAYEGFGLQLCEAMAAGCPTLAARATSLPEVLGDGGETFSLESPTELANLIRRVAMEPDFRERLVQKAQARSTAFSWRKTAEAMAEVYRELISSPSQLRGMVS